MTHEEILKLARSSARRAARQLNCSYEIIEDYEDVVQEAAVAIFTIVNNDPTRTNGYYVVVGANAIMRYLTRIWWNTPHALYLSRAGETIAIEEQMPKQETALTMAHDPIAAGRLHGGGRAQRAIMRDRAIVDLRASGWTEQQIADELGLTKSNVHMALTRMRQRGASA